MSAPPNTSPIPKPLFTIIPHRVVWQPSSNGQKSDKKPIVVKARRCRRSPNSNRTSERTLAANLKKLVKNYAELEANSAVLREIYTELHDIDENMAELEAKAHLLGSSTEKLKAEIKEMYDKMKPTVP